jgi:prepilin-type N-terminal cleavage/methylation domain-containing protein
LGSFLYFFKLVPTAIEIHEGKSRLGLKYNSRGFTLIEIAIVMVIIGVLAGGGVSLMGMLTKRKARTETIDYLEQAQAALISFADINGRLPWVDTSGDGLENAGATSGSLPFQTLRLSPTDPYKRTLRYEFNANLGTSLTASCSALRAGLSGGPDVVDADGTPASFPIAAILVSAGTMDADSDGNVFDDIITGTHLGDNRDGNPNYIRHPSVDNFDDLVVYLGENKLYGEICEYLKLAVKNDSGATVHVHNLMTNTNLNPALNASDTATFDILSGTRIEIQDSLGNNVVSEPSTPMALAGHGFTIYVPSP